MARIPIRSKYLVFCRHGVHIQFIFTLSWCICSSLRTGVSANEITKTQILMGTSVSITVDDNSQQSTTGIEIAFKEIKRFDGILSTFEYKSYISKLNRDGYLDDSPVELLDVISKGLYYSSISEGAFDITVKPVLDLYRACYRTHHRPPSASQLSVASALVDYRNVVVSSNRIDTKKRGTQITTDGIAKGYIIDHTIGVLASNGVRSALINIGGDFRAMGRKSDGTPWIVALQNPRDSHDHLTIIQLLNKAVATSGDYERYFVSEKPLHHIVDPRTGHSATSLISATVIANKAIDADALATSIFVMGPEKGMPLVETLKNVEALVVTRGRIVLKSSGFDLFTETYDSPF